MSASCAEELLHHDDHIAIMVILIKTKHSSTKSQCCRPSWSKDLECRPTHLSSALRWSKMLPGGSEKCFSLRFGGRGSGRWRHLTREEPKQFQQSSSRHLPAIHPFSNILVQVHNPQSKDKMTFDETAKKRDIACLTEFLPCQLTAPQELGWHDAWSVYFRRTDKETRNCTYHGMIVASCSIPVNRQSWSNVKAKDCFECVSCTDTDVEMTL